MTKIEWCDDTINPVWGCGHGCWFCYAKTFGPRFAKQFAAKLYPGCDTLNQIWIKKYRSFTPASVPFNLMKYYTRKKPTIYFVGSMSDINFWSQDQMNMIRTIIDNGPQHIFLFLTKAPNIYNHIKNLPKNCWFGVSCTTNQDIFNHYDSMVKQATTGRKIFISMEPWLEPLSILEASHLSRFDWIIMGELTGTKRFSKKTLEENYPHMGEMINGGFMDSINRIWEFFPSKPIFIKGSLEKRLRTNLTLFPKEIQMIHDSRK